MSTVWIVVITLFVYWALGMIIFTITGEDETFAAYWAMGLVYWILYVVCYPIRWVRSRQWKGKKKK